MTNKIDSNNLETKTMPEIELDENWITSFTDEQLKEAWDHFYYWESEVYPRVWHKAYYIGTLAKEHGLPRECNLRGEPFCHEENVLKVYKSTWEQGYDNTTDGISRFDLLKE